ncbi:hypothetical protein [Pantoea sp. B65]|uniref:hypothetical protein n=1 Tax=Pantoea sp. B65 TaxID=2813359 RepID=UPI0039B4B229
MPKVDNSSALQRNNAPSRHVANKALAIPHNISNSILTLPLTVTAVPADSAQPGSKSPGEFAAWLQNYKNPLATAPASGKEGYHPATLLQQPAALALPLRVRLPPPVDAGFHYLPPASSASATAVRIKTTTGGALHAFARAQAKNAAIILPHGAHTRLSTSAAAAQNLRDLIPAVSDTTEPSPGPSDMQLLAVAEESESAEDDIPSKAKKPRQISAKNRQHLSATAQEWLEKYPAQVSPFGKVMVQSVAKIFVDHKTEIDRLGITLWQLAAFHQVKAESLNTSITELKKQRLLIAQLDANQQQWLAKHPAETIPQVKSHAKAVAKLYVAHQAELTSLKLTDAHLAALHGIQLHNLKTLIRAQKNILPHYSNTLAAEKRGWLDQFPWQPGIYGKVPSVEIAAFYFSWRQQLTKRKITVKDLATYLDVNYGPLSRYINRLSQRKDNIHRMLPDNSKKILDQLNWQRQENEPVAVAVVAKRWFEQQEVLEKNRISREDMALYHGVRIKDLTTEIKKLDICAEKPQAKLTAEESKCLEEYQPQKQSLTAKEIAKLYIAMKRTKDKKISVPVLAGHYKVASTSIYNWIPQCESRQLTTEEIKWLQQHGPEKDNAEAKDVAELYHANKSFKGKKYIVPSLAAHYGISTRLLYSWIRQLEESKLTAEGIAWLKKHGPVKNPSGKVAPDELAVFYLARKKELNSHIENFSIKNLALHYKISWPILITRMGCLKMSSTSHNAPQQLTAEAQTWLAQHPLSQRKGGQGTIDAAARYWLAHKDQLKSLGISIGSLSGLFGLSPERVWSQKTLFQEQHRLATMMLTPQAIMFLEGLKQQLKQKQKRHISAASVATFCAENSQQINQLQISELQIARYFGFNVVTFSRKLALIRAAGEATTAVSADIAIKQEPDSNAADDVTVWNEGLRQRSAGYADVPVQIPPEDELILLGHQQGPLREKLASVDINTVSFIDPPAPLRLKRNAARLNAAEQRCRLLVQAAQNGTLYSLMQQEGYFTLFRDEENPQLGWEQIALKDLPQWFVLAIYSGILYENEAAYHQAAFAADSSFPDYAFEIHSRPLTDEDDKAIHSKRVVTTGIDGRYKTGPAVFINTAKSSKTGKALASKDNNLIVVKAEHNIIALITNQPVKKGQKLRLYYGPHYLMQQHKPVLIKKDPAMTGQQQLIWLASNIDNPYAWVDSAIAALPRLMAQNPLFRNKKALLVITDRQGTIIQVTDSLSGQPVSPAEALQSRRPLAVMQHDDDHHYNCWLSVKKGSNVSFSQVAADFQVTPGGENRLQPIARSGFCMTEAAATALLERGRPPLSEQTIAKHGQALRRKIKKFILQASPEALAELAAPISETR